jgi:hypothetical protein
MVGLGWEPVEQAVGIGFVAQDHEAFNASG